MQLSVPTHAHLAPAGLLNRRILRLPGVEHLTGFKRAHIYSLMNQGRFPKSVRLGPRAVGWDSLAIEKWVEDRISGKPAVSAVAHGALL
ncbi:AlpA family transcriptional regulator [Pseudomonas sp. NPDC077649]|uniref:AlpA family transcriptional regulator n=1 Tax=Pseudomonas sp. NPDC077649 TaxID=3364423 RepID=UPI0037C7C32D